MSYDYILSKLQTFKGTKRRYTVKTQETMFFVDDYTSSTAIRYIEDNKSEDTLVRKSFAIFP